MMENSKPWYYRVIALFCALLICSCLVVFSFLVPHVKAESIMDQWEDYIDDTFFEGSSSILEELVQSAAGASSPTGAGIVTGVMLGLNMISVDRVGHNIPVDSIYTSQGYYNYNQEKFLCSSTIYNGDYNLSDGGYCLAQSEHFSINALVTASNVLSRVTGYTSGYWVGAQWVTPQFPANDFTYILSGGGSIFPNYDGTSTNSNDLSLGAKYSPNTVINHTDYPSGIYTRDYFRNPYGNFYVAGGLNGNTNISWSSLGLPSGTTIDSDNVYDFAINVFNPWVEENYPELTVYLFYPSQDTTDDTGDSGNCNCVHNIYVDVTCYYDPEINVYVTEYITIENNVEVELPSDWVQDFTLTTDPYEVDTIPIPTAENSEPVTMPTIDASEYEEAYGNAIDFWFYVAHSFIEKMHLQLIIAFAFALSVVGFCLWKLGGGGKE